MQWEEAPPQSEAEHAELPIEKEAETTGCKDASADSSTIDTYDDAPIV